MARSRRKTWFWSMALALLVIATGWAVVKARRARVVAEADRAREAGKPLPIRTGVAEERAFDDVIGATALTMASEIASIWGGPRLGLRETLIQLSAVHVVEGQSVEQGELLFELDSRLFGDAVKRQEMALAIAETELEITQRLLGDGLVTDLELQKARLQLESAEFDLEIARRDLERCLVRSPIDGFADVVTVVLGEQVTAGREFTRILKLDPIHVIVDFPQERVDDVFVGQKAEVVLDSFPQEAFEAEVLRVSPHVDVETRVLPVVLQMPNPSSRIRAGMSGFARLRSSGSATTVPATAIIRRGGRAIVFRVEGGQARIREVRVGRMVDVGVLEIQAGLEPGDEIVIFGQESLRDGDAVDAGWQRWARRD